MFNWFRSRKKSFLSDWDIEDLPGFEKINNSDSIQYINADQSRIIYLSTLIVSGNNSTSLINYERNITVTKESGAWQLRGSKTHQNQILACVITVTNEADVEWGKTYFAAIKAL